MTEPYYEDDYVTLYHGDCLEVTEWLTADDLSALEPVTSEVRSSGWPRHESEEGLFKEWAP